MLLDKVTNLVGSCSTTLIISSLVVILVCYLLFGHYLHRYPPGPWGVPLLGCWPWMTHDWHKDFDRLGRGYGDLYTIWLLNTPVLVFQGWDAIVEAFNKQTQVWCSRPLSHGFIAQGVSPNLVCKTEYNEAFKTKKKFLMSTVKKVSFGHGDFTEKIQDEVDAIVRLMRETNQEPFLVEDTMGLHAANPIALILLGKAYTPNDEQEFKVCIKNALDWFTYMAEACEADVLPILRFFPRKSIQPGKEAAANQKAFFGQIIAERREQFDPNNIQCLIDQCIDSEIDDEEILLHLLAYFGDGVFTVPGVIRLWIHLIASHPEVQRKVQDEIHHVIGDRLPNTSDRLTLPYLEATIMETIRVGPPLPISMPNETYADTEIFGYMIPKGTKYMVNFLTVHKDPRIWEKPDVFYPERYITKEGTCNYRHEGWCGYGMGRRSCLGEPIAKQLIYILAANLCQRFTFSFPVDEVRSTPGDAQSLVTSGVTTIAGDFSIIATPRDT